MGSATLDLVFSKSSKGFLDDQPHPERSHIIELVVNLRTDSRLLTPDSSTIIPFLMPPAVGMLYRERCHWIVVYVNLGRLVIANIGAAHEEPQSLA